MPRKECPPPPPLTRIAPRFSQRPLRQTKLNHKDKIDIGEIKSVGKQEEKTTYFDFNFRL